MPESIPKAGNNLVNREPRILLGRVGPLVVLVIQSCLTLCDPIDCSLPGSFVHGISQTRILEWVAIPFSRASSQPRDETLVSHIAGIAADSLQTGPPGKHFQQISVIYITEWIILTSLPSLSEQRAVNYPSRRIELENLGLTPDSASSTLRPRALWASVALHVKWTWKKLFHEVGDPWSDIIEVNTLMLIGYYSIKVLKDLKTKLWNNKKKSAILSTSQNWFQAHHWF